MRPQFSRLSASLALLTLFAISTQLSATFAQGTINYTFSGTGSGSLGGQSFTSSAFVITATADSANVHIGPGLGGNIFAQVADVSASIYVSGVGTADFSAPSNEDNNQTGGIANFAVYPKTGGATGLLIISSPVFRTYDLKSNVGPVSATLGVFSTDVFATSVGDFSLTSVASAVTYQAALQSAPEPAPLGLLGVGLATFNVCLWQRRRTSEAEHAV